MIAFVSIMKFALCYAKGYFKNITFRFSVDVINKQAYINKNSLF